MKSILTNARQDELESFARKVDQGQGQGSAGSDQDDETLIFTTKTSESEGCLWLIKLPAYLLERWSAVDEDGRQLGTLRVWDTRNPANGHPYMTIYTPSEEDPKVMEEFDIVVWGDVVKNRYVFTAQADDDGVGGEGEESSSDKAPRAKLKVLVGKVTSRFTVQPTYDDAYSMRMHERYEAARPQRHIELIEFREGVKLMMRDVSKGDIINTAIKKSKLAKRSGDRDPKDKFTRMSHDALVKLLFVVFGEKPLWGLNELRLRTEQPKAYLQQVLPEVAEKVEKGSDKGKWKLTSGYRDAVNALPEEGGSQSSNAAKDDLDDDDDDDSEDDSDMEEI